MYCTKYFRLHLNTLISIHNTNLRTKSTTSLPMLTKDKYQIKRGQYNYINSDHIKKFRNLIGHNRVLTETYDTDKYNTDWFQTVRGQSQIVLKPQTTAEMSSILRFCNTERLAVCPQGGNTGVSGGSIPVFDEIVISTELMNNIEGLDDTSGVLVCQAGCVLETLESHVGQYGFIMPLDLGAKGSCQIGGNVSTNAGGTRLVRYGNLHGTVLGLEVVLANGEILDCLSTLKKDNTGYHLKHLFIGSEGTLGIITKIAINCPTRLKAQTLAFVAVETFEKSLLVLKQAKQELGEIISAIELMDSHTLYVVKSNLKKTVPLESHAFSMIIETSGSNEKHDQEKLNLFLQKTLQGGYIVDGIITSEPSKIKALWEIRERAIEAQLMDGYLYTFDLSMPIQEFYSIVPEVIKRLSSKMVRVTGFGHMGDGNLHLNISAKEYSDDVQSLLDPFVYEYTGNHRGSISAEHGIGFLKTKYLQYSKSSSSIHLMKQLKQLLDPNRILNPYKVLPS